MMKVMMPELDYVTMNISEGQTASNSWGKMIAEDLSQDEKDKIY